MSIPIFDSGSIFCVFLENEMILGTDRAMMSVKFDCRDREYTEKGILLYGSRENGLLRSYIEVCVDDGIEIFAMHDGRAEIKPISGSRLSVTENETGYKISCSLDENDLNLSLNGECRVAGNEITIRRGESRMILSETINKTARISRRGFEYEAEKCLSLIGTLRSDSELLPLILLTKGLKDAYFDKNRAEKIKEIIPTMSEQNKKTAEDVLSRYYRTFGVEER